MPPEAIDRIRASLDHLRDGPGSLVDAFYRRLFELDPALRTLFPDHLGAQADKLAAMLASIIAALDHPAGLPAMFADLGRRHVGYGVREAHYDAVGAALLRGLHDALGNAWSPAVEDAWAQLYGEMAEAMLEAADAAGGAAEASPPGGTAPDRTAREG